MTQLSVPLCDNTAGIGPMKAGTGDPFKPHVCSSTHLSPQPTSCCGPMNAVCAGGLYCQVPSPSKFPRQVLFLAPPSRALFPLASLSHFCVSLHPSKAWACATTSRQPMHVSTWKACAQHPGRGKCKGQHLASTFRDLST